MGEKEFYQVKESFCNKETFSNAILLLSMVKSEYYYIIGFSRQRGIIEIGFDFESEIHGVITESILLDIYSSDEYVYISSQLANIDLSMEYVSENKNFKIENNEICYYSKVLKDELIPLSITVLNNYILSAKREIIDFLEHYYKFILSGSRLNCEDKKGNLQPDN